MSDLRNAGSRDVAVSRAADRHRLLWAGGTVFDVVLAGEHTGGSLALLEHAFRVDTAQARLITVTAPAGFADFVRAAGVSIDGKAPATWEFDVERIMAAAPRHGIEIVGPPPG